MSDPTPTPIPDPLVEFFLDIAKDLGKSLWDITIGRGKKEIDWKISARRYAEEIIKQYGKIQVYGQARPTPLLDIFTDVYILEKPVALRRYDIQSLQKWFSEREKRASLHQREERMPGLSALDRTNKLYILGKPGAGKTTFLKYLAVLAAGGSAKLPYIPIFISLKAYADSGESLLDFIAHQFDICNFENAMPFIERMLKNGKALVLFDGLDEVGAEDGRRGEVIDALRDFSRKYDANKIVITCRVAATEYVFEGFEYVEMADFTPEQVERFITNWFGDEPELGEQMLAELGKPENEGILELTQTPLLLNLMCVIFEQKKKLSQKKSDLYEEGVDILLQEWDEEKEVKRDKIYRDMTVRRREHMLSVLAFESFVRNEFYIPVRKLENRIGGYLAKVYKEDELDIDSRAVLKAISAQHGLLIEVPHRYYSFPHLTFQEYFTARYIVDNEARGAVAELMQHAFDDRWREVFLLVASMLDDADAFFERFLNTLDAYAAENGLSPWLAWAEAKRIELEEAIRVDAAQRGIDPVIYRPAAGRIWWTLRALTRERTLARVRVLTLARARALVLAVDLNLDLVRALDLARALALDLPRTLDLARAFAFDLDLDLDRALALDLVRAFDFDFARALNLARKSSLSELSQALQTLQRPSSDAPEEQWRVFSDRLEELISQYRPSAQTFARFFYETQLPPELQQVSDKHIYSWRNYFKGIQFLLNCLNLAIVTDRRAIEDRLLLPPTDH